MSASEHGTNDLGILEGKGLRHVPVGRRADRRAEQLDTIGRERARLLRQAAVLEQRLDSGMDSRRAERLALDRCHLKPNRLELALQIHERKSTVELL